MHHTAQKNGGQGGFTPLPQETPKTLVSKRSEHEQYRTSESKGKGHTVAVTGFTLVELLITVGIISILATGVMVAMRGATVRARDTKRKAELTQVGRLLQSGCRAPDGGMLDIDLKDYAVQLAAQYPQYQSFLQNVPKDPQSGNDAQSGYRYIVNNDTTKCAVYANLENNEEPISLPAINTPTPGGGTGTLRTYAPGPNGTNILKQNWFSDQAVRR